MSAPVPPVKRPGPAKRSARGPAKPTATLAGAEVMASGDDPEATRRMSRLSLPTVEAASTTLRGVVINVTFLIAFALIVPALLTQLWKDQVVIAPIAVPQALVDRGLSSEVMSNRIWDALQGFARDAKVAKSTFVAVPQGQNFDFSLTQAGISINGVLSQIRAFFNLYETRIAGEMVCADTVCSRAGMQLRLRIIKAGATVVDLPPMGELTDAQYFRLAAEGVFNTLDPFVSIAALAKSQPDKAIVLARQLVREQTSAAKWAQNLVGEILLAEAHYDEALSAFDTALQMDDGFAQALLNRALTLAHLGRASDADAALAKARGKGLPELDVVKAEASLAAMRGDQAGALAAFLRAATLEPRQPQHLVLAGKTELDLGQKSAGEAHLLEALALDPANADALAALGNLYYGKFGDAPRLDEAVRMYRNWANFDAQNAEAWFSLGNALLSHQRYADALGAYDTSIGLGNTSPQVRIVRAGALMGLALNDQRPLSDAISAWEGLRGLDPPEPTVFLSLGKLYVKSGDTPEAIAAYRRYLEIAPADASGRQTALDALKSLGA